MPTLTERLWSRADRGPLIRALPEHGLGMSVVHRPTPRVVTATPARQPESPTVGRASQVTHRILRTASDRGPGRRAAPIDLPAPNMVMPLATARVRREGAAETAAARPVLELSRRVAPLVHRSWVDTRRPPSSAPSPSIRTGPPTFAPSGAAQADLDALRHDVLGQVLRELERQSERGGDPDGLDLWR